ncbi:MAG: radical SAM protein [Oscillospiraceae bacterium]|nr:radical SAM protein [Oscillospiraceae bacterium]
MSARQTIIPVFVPHVGCPNDCVFCNQRRISGAVRPITPREVSCAIEQGAAITPNGVQRQLAFYGGSFTAIPAEEQERLLDAVQPYLADGTIDSIRLSTRPDAIDDTVLSRLKKYGVKTIELGAQSMDDIVLEMCGRGHTAKHVEQAAQLVKQHGFDLILQMMTGLPGDEDGSSSLVTARRLAALRPNGVRIYPTVIVRDTALYELWQAGMYREHSVEDAVTVCAQIVPIFEDAGIPVIRLGLNPTEELSNGDAAGGAYHPALGELVKSRMMLNRASQLLQGVEQGCSVILEVGKGKISQMVGQHRCNICALERKFNLKSIKIKEKQEKSDEISLKFVAK